MARKAVYRLAKGEGAILDRARHERNPNWVTNYYMRSAATGTYWREVLESDVKRLKLPEFVEAAQRWQSGYESLHEVWTALGKPEYFYPEDDKWYYAYQSDYNARSERLERIYRVFDDDETGKPVFHHPHGALMLPWQLDLYKARQPIDIIVGGFGCIAPETRIYDVRSNKHISVKEMADKGYAPTVLSWNGSEMVPQQAMVPFKKGRAQLYRVTTVAGRTVTVTMEHKFLTSDGYKTLREISSGSLGDVPLLLSASSLPRSSLAPYQPGFLQDVHHLKQTTVDFQCGCRPCCHLSGEQPHLIQDNDPGVAPLPADAHVHNQQNWHGDDRAFGSTHNQTCQLCGLLSSPDVSHLAALPGWQEGEFSVGEESDEPALLLHSGSESLQSRGTSIGRRQVQQSYLSSATKTIGVSSHGLDFAQMPQGDASSYQEQTEKFQGALELPATFQDHKRAQSVVAQSYQDTSATSFFSFSRPSYYTVYDKIVRIEQCGKGDFYDLHVPVYNNYLAEGLIHHNSGKTIAKILHMMTRAVLLPGYRGFVLAPYSIQSMEVYTQALMMTSDTLFEERFILRAVTKPFPTLEIGHDGVGRNTIEFYPILDDPDKIRTLTGDEGMVDQIEKLPDIQNVIRVLGTRLRGQYQGRPRVGKITLIGNPDDNPEMWDLIDDADNDPDMLWAYRPATHENTYLTVADFIRFQKQVGEDEESQGMYLFGRKPKGGGKHFPAESIQRLHDESLDDYMKENLESGIPGFVRIERPKVGVHRWETPRLPDHEYLVIADPGWGNPPYRNSPVVGVWDITTFAFGGPARLVAFEWVFGNGSPNPWIAKYNEYVLNYHAIGNNAYDATGFQSVYQSLADTGLEGLLAEPINLGGQKKLSALNLAKKMMADGRFSAPNIPHMFSQLAKYDLPDNQLRQDIVSFILVTAQWLERLYYIDMSEGDDDPYDESDRAWREEESRYPGRTE